VGSFFTTSLALGVLITPEPDLLEALFGNIEKIAPIEGFAAIASSIVIILLAKLISRKLILGIISGELLQSLNISGKKINFIYLLLVGSVVALGVKFVGTLLMGGLVIIPAASAKNVSKSIDNYHLLSVVFGITSGVIGVLVSTFYQIASGPSVVLTSIVIFISTYFLKKKV